MNLTPTQRSYLISTVSFAVLAAALPVLDLVARGEPVTSWQPLAAAAAGGLVGFLRDWLKNNSGAVLEKPLAERQVLPPH